MGTKIDTINGPVQTGNKSTQNNNVDIKIKKISDSFNGEIISIKNDFKKVKKASIFYSILFAIFTGLITNFLYDLLIRSSN